MIVCAACHAENPDGTKICVKCGTELPKAVGAAGPAKAKAAPAAEPTHRFGLFDLRRELFDLIWLLVILFVIVGGFWMEATHWAWPPRAPWNLGETEEAKTVPTPVLAMVHRHHAPANPTQSNLTTQPVTGTQVVSPPPPSVEKPAVQYGNPDTFYAKGKDKFDHQKYYDSFNYLKQALMIDPTYAKAYFGLGYLYAHFNMNDVAVRMYEMALRFDPSHADSVHNLGVMYYQAGNYGDALDLFKKAVELNDQNADYEFYLGSTYLEMGQPSDALQPLQKATTLRSDDPMIHYNLARAYEMLGKKQEALDAMQKVVQFSKDPDLTQNAKSHIDYLQSQS
jgi:Flp pilus assembly protein TadD